MSAYQQIIESSLPGLRPEQHREIEEIMRRESGGTLDRFTRAQLIGMAVRAALVLPALEAEGLVSYPVDRRNP